MALTLYLLRHAKAVVADGKTPDFDRPLAVRGHRESVELASLLADRSYAPARVLCSSSQRTRETLGPLLSAWPINASIEIARDLYNASANELLVLVRKQSSDTSSLMLIGHNPGIEQLARGLVGSGEDAVLRRLHDHYPPAGLAVIEFDSEAWADIRLSAGRLSAFEAPRG